MRWYYGWNVVGAVFAMATFSFGLGFYAVTVYVATLQGLHGWSASTVSAPITVYYLAGALVTMAIGDVYARLGPRVVVALGGLALAAGVTALGSVTRPWQLYPICLVMALGWGALSGAAINIILAPWWQRRRGLAVSLAFNGATLGGVVVTPALIVLIGAIGFARAGFVAAVVALLVFAAAVAVMRRGPAELGLAPDGDPLSSAAPPSPAAEPGWRREALRTWRFWSVSAPFALGLAAQVGVLTHLVALVTPVLGLAGAARAVSTATAMAVLGRLATGAVVDRASRRVVAGVTLAVQVAGVLVLARAGTPAEIYLGCALFGAGIGNLTSLPGLILSVEWPRERFAPLVGLVVGINQLTFAFGPSLVGVLRDLSGRYAPALAACAALQAIAAVIVLCGPGRGAKT
jgi:MFS family permease